MMKTACTLSFLLTALLLSPSAGAKDSARASDNDARYNKAGVIRIKDSLALEVGSRKDGENVFEIDLPSLHLFTGHVCGGVASGFLLAKEALSLLFPNEIPDRDRLKVTASKSACFLDPIMLITGTRAPLEGNTGDHEAITINPELSKDHSEMVILFERTDIKRAVKAGFSKKRMLKHLPKQKRKKFMSLKMKVETKTATKSEQRAFAEAVQRIVGKLIKKEIKSFTLEVIEE
jgi:formylmethanofuran dehydrogenase subunit E